MNLLGYKVKWETVSLAALLGLIGIGFITMLIAVLTFKAPDNQLTKKPVEEAVGPLRSKTKTYTSKQMTIHTFNDENAPLAAFRDPDKSQNDLIPDVPASLRGKETSLDAMLDPRLSAPARNKKAEEDLLAEEEEKVSTGWGWLADDIAKSKMTRESEGDKSKQQKADEEDQDEEDDRLAAEKKKEASGDKDQNKDYFFMNHSFEENASRTDPLSRSALREDDRNASSDTDRDGEGKSDEERKEESASQDKASEAWRASAAGNQETGMGERDPFGRREDGQRVFSDDSWGFSRDADLSSRREENAATAATALRREEDYGQVDQSMRLIGDADNDAGRMSVGWTGYSSDSMFNSGGGYTPRGVGSSGGESLFSGAGVFNNSSDGIVIPIASSSGGGSLSTESSFGTPSYSSPIGNTRSGTEIATPRALPW